MGCAAACCKTATVAELLCASRVIPSPSASPQTGCWLTCISICRKNGACAMGARVFSIKCTPSNSIPKPNSARPAPCADGCRAATARQNPAARAGRPSQSRSIAKSCAVRVVPTLAPNSTGSAWGSSKTPALTKPTTKTTAAELLCSAAVTSTPVSRPCSGRPVTQRSTCCIRSPAACCSPRVNWHMPNKNSATPAARPAALYSACISSLPPVAFASA